MKLTIAFVSSRYHPKFKWFYDSLEKQVGSEDVDVIAVSQALYDRHDDVISEFYSTFGKDYHFANLTITPPKPSVWKGSHRLTKEDWWSKSNDLNTAILLCKTDYIAFVDDRCVLAPTWLGAIKRAMHNEYAVCGTYEKRANMKVENGVIVDEGTLLGSGRPQGFGRTHDWWGGSYALPLEWCLAVNGWSEDVCDGLGSEDSQFGMTLRNSGYSMFYDSDLKIIEDRTPSEIGGGLKRADKMKDDVVTNAKSWDIVRIFKTATTSQNSYDIRNMRDRILLNHEPFPPPSAANFDWYDKQPLSEIE